jgi:tRNA1Val (adenine37-N6)-methyltransferase
MPNNYFKFKQFTIQQEYCAMKVGTDGVLLGAWINIGDARTILDIGTGTGLIALMLAQRSGANIDALDIDAGATKQTLQNFKNSPWNDRLNVIHEPFQTYSQKSKTKYDLLITNPPYFSGALKSQDEKRSAARHDHLLNRMELLEGSVRLLNARGRLGIILPIEEYNLFSAQIKEWNFFEIRKAFVIPKPDKKATRVMAELSFTQEPVETREIIIEKYGRHAYSEEYIDLTREYYLKF